MIKFGTSGWRGLIAHDFNFQTLRQAAAGTALYLKEKNAKAVIVGYDTRFLGRKFAQEVALVLGAHGIATYLTDRDCPTPVISSFIIQNKIDGGINITASHNPYNYSGFKFSPAWGGPALPEDTKKLEKLINGIRVSDIIKMDSLEEAKEKGLFKEIDASMDYFKLIEENLKLENDSLKNVKVFYDAIYGTGRGFVDKLCTKHGCEVEVMHDRPDPYFDEKGPDPSSDNLSLLKQRVKENEGLVIGLATDGDADRFGIVGSNGEFIEPNKIIALLADHLYSSRSYPSGMGIARSFATGSQIDLVAQKYGLKIYENPVGFKYIGKLIADKKIVIGGEESAGLSIFGHVPEKDGILACMLMVELLSQKKATSEELLEDLHKRVGRKETKRENHRVSDEIKLALKKRLDEIEGRFLGREVERIEKTDGTKIYLKSGSWLLFRESGTEPLIRIYGESGSHEDLENLMEKARGFLLK